MTASTSNDSPVDSMAFSMQALTIRDEVAQAAISKAKELLPQYLMRSASVWATKADFYSKSAYDDFKSKLTQTFSEPKYVPYITLVTISQEKFFNVNLPSQIVALITTQSPSVTKAKENEIK